MIEKKIIAKIIYKKNIFYIILLIIIYGVTLKNNLYVSANIANNYDFNDDGIVDTTDVQLLQNHWLETEDHKNWDSQYNLSTTPNSSNKQIINYLDLAIISDNLFTGCPYYFNEIDIDEPLGDATEGAPSYVDIKNLSIKQIGEYVQFIWEGNGNLLNNDDQYYFIFLDTDLNANTGARYGSLGVDIKIGIGRDLTAKYEYFKGEDVVYVNKFNPVFFEGNMFYLNIKKDKISSDVFKVYFETSGNTVYRDESVESIINLRAVGVSTEIVVESPNMVLSSNPTLINISSKESNAKLNTYIIRGEQKKLLSPSEVSFYSYHKVANPNLKPTSSIIALSNNEAKYINDGYIFAIPQMNECHLTPEKPIVIATGDVYGNPQTDNVIAVFPKNRKSDIIDFSFDDMMKKYPNYIKTVSSAYSEIQQLYNGYKPYNGDKQIYAFLDIPGHCGGNNNPLETAPTCYMNYYDGTPQYGVVIHEMGHNFQDTKGMSQLLEANNNRFRPYLAECGASLPEQYFRSKILNNPQSYGLNEDSFEYKTYAKSLYNGNIENKILLNSIEERIRSGEISGIFDVNIGDKIAAICSIFVSTAAYPEDFNNQYGWDFYKRFLNEFDDSGLQNFQEDKVDTFFAATYSNAVGTDMKAKFKLWGFEIDDSYYNDLYVGINYSENEDGIPEVKKDLALGNVNSIMNVEVVNVAETSAIVISLEKKLTILDQKFADKYSGTMFLDVENHGRLWYVDPASKNRFYFENGTSALSISSKLATGITYEDIQKIPVGVPSKLYNLTDSDGDGLPDKLESALGSDPNKVDTDGDGYGDKEELINGYSLVNDKKNSYNQNLINRLEGKMLLQVSGPNSHGEIWYIKNGQRWYGGTEDSMYEIMKARSLGATADNIRKIEVGDLEGTE